MRAGFILLSLPRIVVVGFTRVAAEARRAWAHMDGWGHMGGGWGATVMIALWIIVIAAVVFAIVRITKGAAQSEPGSQSPMDILKRRYARGEISKEEFQERKKELQD